MKLAKFLKRLSKMSLLPERRGEPLKALEVAKDHRMGMYKALKLLLECDRTDKALKDPSAARKKVKFSELSSKMKP